MTDAPPGRPSGGRRLPQWIRWLHLYGSMLGLGATLLFAVTGLTLNHAEWFEAGDPVVRTLDGSLPVAHLAGHVDKLTVAEELRAAHGLRGKVAEFAVEADECLVVWKGPAYSADATIERDTGRPHRRGAAPGHGAARRPAQGARLRPRRRGFVIDAAAVVLAFLSATGLRPPLDSVARQRPVGRAARHRDAGRRVRVRRALAGGRRGAVRSPCRW